MQISKNLMRAKRDKERFILETFFRKVLNFKSQQ